MSGTDEASTAALLLPKALGGVAEGFRFTAICRIFRGALGRTRTCDLLIRSQTRSSTRGDTKGQGETKPRFYQGFITLEGTGRDRERHGVVVPLWYERATDL